jgi:hypothetical protein
MGVKEVSAGSAMSHDYFGGHNILNYSKKLALFAPKNVISGPIQDLF